MKRLLATPILLVAFVAGYVGVAALLDEQPAAPTVQMAPNPAESLIADHGCWTGEAPAGVTVPGHVVVTLRVGRTVYGGPRLTGQALEQIVDGKAHGLRVLAFCE